MFQYIPKNNRNTNPNQITKFSSNLLKSDFNKFGNSKLFQDYQQLLNNNCLYLPNYYCNKNDLTIFNSLKEEIQSQDPINWSKHMKYENPTFSKTFNQIVEKLSNDFNIDVTQSRLNYYRDGNDWKPFHHDSHAYGDKYENYTLGVSFGSNRIMEFIQDDIEQDIKLKERFKFPQHNGDVFGFNKEVNQKFMHSIVKDPNQKQDRFSIIIWGYKKN
jgi:hypothetical protein